MDKLEVSERMAKAIVEYLLKHNTVKVMPITTNYLTMNPYVTKDFLEKYIREAILKYMKKEELELVGEYLDKERERKW